MVIYFQEKIVVGNIIGIILSYERLFISISSFLKKFDFSESEVENRISQFVT